MIYYPDVLHISLDAFQLILRAPGTLQTVKEGSRFPSYGGKPLSFLPFHPNSIKAEGTRIT